MRGHNTYVVNNSNSYMFRLYYLQPSGCTEENRKCPHATALHDYGYYNSRNM